MSIIQIKYINNSKYKSLLVYTNTWNKIKMDWNHFMMLKALTAKINSIIFLISDKSLLLKDTNNNNFSIITRNVF